MTVRTSNGQHVGTKLPSGVALNGKVDVQLSFVSGHQSGLHRDREAMIELPATRSERSAEDCAST